MSHYFGTDGFRGEAGRTLGAAHAYRIGRFLGYLGAKARGRAARFCIGKDTRRSSYMLEYALAAGLSASGADAYMLHVTTTPGVSYVTRSDEAEFDGGIMISASHNPFSDNGIKLLGPAGEKLEGEWIDRLEEFLDTPDPCDSLLPSATGREVGRVIDYRAGGNRYLGYLIALCRHSYEGKRVGLDCANGSAWHLGEHLFRALGAKVLPLGCAPNGENINRGVGSTHPEALIHLVKSSHLDVGFAFDGDADRCLAVDENGTLLTGDHILYILALEWRRRGLLAGDTIVATPMSNLGLTRALADERIRVEIAPVGDRFVYEAMQRGGYHLGGEQSGHIILRPLSNTGDGLLTALTLMEVMAEEKQPLSRLCAPLRCFPQRHYNLPTERKGAVVRDRTVCEALEAQARVLGENGRVLLRESGTEPMVRLMVEAETRSRCEQVAREILRVLEACGVESAREVSEA